ncbi:MAG: tRNA (adenosine(37)-N6)-dimethylallyltransferase MiaA [Clostridia bacterium]|nr:tRNA (adenosine(37)-N6)-dimethylallyltransferase MiaA [Clostridia bacterium]
MKSILFGICGPTASGKTGLAIEVAKMVGGEIVSADSMQIYKGMDILSAKPTAEEMQSVPHHMIGIVSPTAYFSASHFRETAQSAIEDIKSRGKIPILCGGTGLYIDAVTRGMRFSEKSDENLRNELKAISEKSGGEWILHNMLKEMDPEAAEKYPPGDVRRVIRSIEINKLTGMTRKEQEYRDSLIEDAYDARLFAIDWPRDQLYDRINRRVDIMVKNGLINEVSSLMKEIEKGESTSVQAIGYKEIAEALKGEIAMSDAIARLKTASRNYAKRQITWFKKDARVAWLPVTDTKILAEKIAGIILSTEADNG